MHDRKDETIGSRRQWVDNGYGVKMFKMFAVSGMNRIDPVVYHSGYEEIVKDRLGFWAMFFNKPGYRGDNLRRRGDDANIAAFIKSNKLFCLCWRQRVLDPSFVGNDSIKFHFVNCSIHSGHGRL